MSSKKNTKSDSEHSQIQSQSEDEKKEENMASAVNSDAEDLRSSKNLSSEIKSDNEVKSTPENSDSEAEPKKALKKFDKESLEIISESNFVLNLKPDLDMKDNKEGENNTDANKRSKANSIFTSKKSISIINQINEELDELEININGSKKKGRRETSKNRFLASPRSKEADEIYQNNINRNSYNKNNNPYTGNRRTGDQNTDENYKTTKNDYNNNRINNENEKNPSRLNSKNSRLSNINSAGNLNNPFDNNLYKNKNYRDEQSNKDLLAKNNLERGPYNNSNKTNTSNQREKAFKYNNNFNKQTKDFKNHEFTNPYRNQIHNKNLNPNDLYSEFKHANYLTNDVNIPSKESNKRTLDLTKSNLNNNKNNKENNKINNSLHDSMISKKEEYENYLNTISDKASKDDFRTNFNDEFNNENKYLRDEKNSKNSINKLRTIDDLYKHGRRPLIYDNKGKTEQKRNSDFDFYQEKKNNFTNEFYTDLSTRNNHNYMQRNNFEDSKRDDSFLDEEFNKEKGINKAIDILLANDDFE